MHRVALACAIVGIALTVALPEASHAAVIAATSFENEQAASVRYVAMQTHPSLLDMGQTVPLLNQADNPATSSVDETVILNSTITTELGYTASFTRTRDGVGASAHGMTDGDLVGVTNATDNVGRYVDGTQGYQIRDPEGQFNLNFDPVDLTAYIGVEVSLWYFLRTTDYEVDDHLRIMAYTDVGEITLFDSTQGRLQELGVQGRFTQLTAQVPDAATTVMLHVAADTNSDTEAIFLDDVAITGSAIPEPLAAGAVGLLGVIALRRHRFQVD